MNQYPAELRTPPLPLVALVGSPELHREVGSYFSQGLRPPVVSVVGVAEPNEQLLGRLFGPRKAAEVRILCSALLGLGLGSA